MRYCTNCGYVLKDNASFCSRCGKAQTKATFTETYNNGINEGEKVLFVIGGSLGAKNINEAVLKKWNKIQEMENLRLFWGTGKDLFEEVISKITDYGSAVVLPYFDNAADIMSAADMVLCRAGASTVSELIQLEKPS